MTNIKLCRENSELLGVKQMIKQHEEYRISICVLCLWLRHKFLSKMHTIVDLMCNVLSALRITHKFVSLTVIISKQLIIVKSIFFFLLL